MKWSQLKKRAGELLSDSVRGRVQFQMARYHKASGRWGRARRTLRNSLRAAMVTVSLSAVPLAITAIIAYDAAYSPRYHAGYNQVLWQLFWIEYLWPFMKSAANTLCALVIVPYALGRLSKSNLCSSHWVRFSFWLSVVVFVLLNLLTVPFAYE